MSSFMGGIPKPVIAEDTEVPVMSYDEPGLLECERPPQSLPGRSSDKGPCGNYPL